MKVVIMGSGSIGMQYSNLLVKLGVKPVLISVREKRRSELSAEGWETASCMSETMADFCVVATETNRHVSDAIEAIGLGMKVLVEKPLGANIKDVVRLESELCTNELDLLRVVCPLRWYSGVQMIRKNIERLCKIHHVNIWCQSYLPDWRERDYKTSYSADVEQGGVVRDLVHEIDYCNALFGLPSAEDVQCVGTNGNAIGIESSANVHMSWVGGKGEVVSLQLDYLTRKARRGISVYGECGECHADLVSGEYSELINGVGKKEILDNSRDEAMMEMLRSFLDQDGLGCDIHQAKQAMNVIEVCESKLHFN